MRLKDILKAFLEEEKWSDEVEHDDEDDSDYVSTNYVIADQIYSLNLITFEQRKEIKVVLVSPITVPLARRVEAPTLINSLNLRLRYGNLEMSSDGKVYFRWSIDVEGTTTVPLQFRNMLYSAAVAFDSIRVTALGALAFTKLSIDRIWEDYERSLAGLIADQAKSATFN